MVIDRVKTGMRLYKAISAKTKSIRRFSIETGIAETTAHLWFKGVNMPSLDSLAIVSSFSGVKIADLIVTKEE